MIFTTTNFQSNYGIAKFDEFKGSNLICQISVLFVFPYEKVFLHSKGLPIKSETLVFVILQQWESHKYSYALPKNMSFKYAHLHVFFRTN